jgi:hypothetical protein
MPLNQKSFNLPKFANIVGGPMYDLHDEVFEQELAERERLMYARWSTPRSWDFVDTDHD